MAANGETTLNMGVENDVPSDVDRASVSARRPNIKLPSGYTNDSGGEANFLHDMIRLFSDDDSSDALNHEAGVEDLQFLVGQQWDEDIQNKRTAASKPTLTVNRLPAFVGQVLGRRKQNETQIKIAPNAGSTKLTAMVREGLVRSIQKESKAGFAYDNALLGAVAAGIGNWQLDTYYESDDVWDQCIRIRPVDDHFGVVWDRTISNPTGKDADHCFVVDPMPWETYKARWPWATPGDIMRIRFPAELQNTGWWTESDVRVVSYWKMRSRKRVLALMRDNTTHDITDVQDDPATLSQIKARPDGSPFIRTVNKPYAQRYVCSATDVLEGPYELPIDRVPVFRVPGWEIRIGEARHRWGLIRFLKDPQRLHNFWRSVIAEKIMRSPKTTWTASSSSVLGREEAWRSSASNDDPLLIWNAESGQKPERVDPIQIEGALIEQASVTAQDMKDVSNIHEANLGMPSNEVSGRGIEERVAVSETGTAIYHDNLREAIEETGRVADMLIPVIYDTARTVKIILPNNQEEFVAINQTVGDEAKLDITRGKYTVTAVTGRSYETKQQESVDSMLGLAQSMPEALAVGSDILVEAMDFPQSDRLARRLRRSIPAQLLDPEERTPEQTAAMQATSQQSQQQQQVDSATQAADILKTASETVLNRARAANYGQAAAAIPQKTQNESLNVASQVADREVRSSLEAIKVATGA